MDANTIGAALKRKLGPLPVWVWSILGGVVVYFLRKRGYFGGGVQEGETLQPRQASATTPQAQTVLQPGESVYDPNTGALTTAPGNDTGNAGDTSPGSSGGGSGDYAQAIQDMVDAITNGLTQREQPDRTSPTAHKKLTPLDRAKAAVKRGKVGPKNEARLEHAGYTKGQIAYHTKKRTALGKPAHKPGSHRDTTSHTTRQSKPRSSANVRNAHGGRTTPQQKAAKARTGKSRTPQALGHAKRPRPTAALTRHATAVHHPASSAGAKPHQQAQKQQPGTHRPSSPPPRSTRPQAQKPAPKKPKKRH